MLFCPQQGGQLGKLLLLWFKPGCLLNRAYNIGFIHLIFFLNKFLAVLRKYSHLPQPFLFNAS